MWKEKKKRGERGTCVKRETRMEKEERVLKEQKKHGKRRTSVERQGQVQKENHVLPDADKAAAWKWRGSWQKTRR